MEFPPLSQAMRKAIRALHRKQHRDEEEIFLIEGEKLCAEAVQSGADIRYAVVQSTASPVIESLIHQLLRREIPVYETSTQHFEHISDTQTPQGILAVVAYPHTVLAPEENLLVLDGIADPGNLGTIIRTAEWFGITNLLLGPHSADRFHPKALRSTMGSIFRCSVEMTSSIPDTLEGRFPNHTLYGASLQAEASLEDILPDEPFGLVLGSESHGISPEVQELIDKGFRIQGAGRAESLNVAIAAGIALYHFHAQHL